MVATGLPVLPATAASAVATATDSPAPSATIDGGFLGTLLQLLTLPESGPSTTPVAVGPLADLLQERVADELPEAPNGIMPALPPVPVALPTVQPAEIRAAQLLARHAGSSATESTTALADAIEDVLANGSVHKGPVQTTVADAGQPLLALLPGTVPDGTRGAAFDSPAPSPSLPSGTVQGPVTELTHATRPASTETVIARHINAPVGSHAWPDELGAQLHMMADKGHSMASLRLSPEHLGPLEIQISVKDAEASVWFGATNAETRAALEQAMPRLKELFAAQGMSLLQAGVFSQTSQGSNRNNRAQPGDAVTQGEGTTAEITTRATRSGLIDAYA